MKPPGKVPVVPPAVKRNDVVARMAIAQHQAVVGLMARINDYLNDHALIDLPLTVYPDQGNPWSPVVVARVEMAFKEAGWRVTLDRNDKTGELLSITLG